MTADFQLNPSLDMSALAARFAADGRLRIDNFLAPDGADRLHALLRASEEWRLIFNQSDKVFELDRDAQAQLSPEKRSALEQAIQDNARYDFQYAYEVIRIADGKRARRERGDLLSNFASFLNSPKAIDAFRTITGEQSIAFADAQATAYGPGHFLTAHDDEVAGKQRHAAYVFGLTPRWRTEWGGLLLFHGDHECVSSAWSPTFNSLNLFRVPQAHSVSFVTPSAANRRYSITGWLRGGRQD